MNLKLKKLCVSALFLALALVLPFLTGQIGELGQMLSPMHIPVLLCGFICGPWWGAAVGITAPLLRSLMFSMPPMFPVAFAMAFELCAYGFFSGLLYKLLPQKNAFIYVDLLSSMLIGRIVWGAVKFAIAGFTKTDFTFPMYFAAVFTGSIPGIILQIVLIPLLIMALKKAGLVPLQKKQATPSTKTTEKSDAAV